MPEVDRKPTWQSGDKPKKRPRGRPKGHRISVQASEQITAIKRRLDLSDAILTFRDIADELSKRRGKRVGLGTVYRFAAGQYPQGSELRKVFGLPVTVLVAVCPHCDQPPLTKHHRCPGTAPKPRKPTKNARRKRLIHDERWRELFMRMVRR